MIRIAAPSVIAAGLKVGDHSFKKIRHQFKKIPKPNDGKKAVQIKFKSPDIPFCSRISRFDGAEFIGDNRRNKQFNRFESGEAGVNPAQWRYGDRFYTEVRLPDGL